MQTDFQDRANQFRLDRAKQRTKAKRAARPDFRYTKFKATYRNDPVAFIHDVFEWKEGKGPTLYQDDIIQTLYDKKRLAVRGPHGLGKSALSAFLIHWFALTRDGDSDWKAPTTASNWRQLTKFLWPEIHKWARRIRWDKVGRNAYDERLELQTLGLRLKTGEAFAVASNNPGFIEGAHADSLLYIFDESKLIPGSTFDAAEGAFSGAGADGIEAFALAVSTPGETAGRFYDIHERKPGLTDWAARHVTVAEAIKAGRISPEWVAARAAQWGKQSAIYLNRVEGEFADSSEVALIPLSWVEKSFERFEEIEGAPYEDATSTLGVDVARYGDDRTAICQLTGDVLEWLEYHSKEGTMQTAGRVASIVGEDFDITIGVDANGVGAGVFDRLEELGYNVVSMNVLEATDVTDSTGLNKFNNLYSAIWWALRERLDPDGPEPLALCPDDDLLADLVAPTWGYASNGRIVVEPKAKVKERLGRSPDGGDALAEALYAQTPQVWSFSD